MTLRKRIINKWIQGVMYLSLALSALPGVSYAGGGAPDSLCIMADDFGDMARRRLEVEAIGAGSATPAGYTWSNNGWYDSGVSLLNSGALRIMTRGSVELCKNSSTGQAATVSLDPTNDGWQRLNLPLPYGKRFKLSATGSVSGLGGTFTNGHRLYVYIGTTPPPSDWVGNAAPLTGADPQFFELNNPVDYATPSVAVNEALWEGEVPAAIVYFRFAEGPISNPWVGDYTDNTGSYTVTVTRFHTCELSEGEALIAYVGSTPPNITSLSGAGPNIINLDDCAKNIGACGGSYAGEFNGVAPSAGQLWFKILDTTDPWGTEVKGDGDYSSASNQGYYTVNVTTTKAPDGGLSNFINAVINPIRVFLQGDIDPNTGKREGGLTKRLYEGVTGDVDYIAFIRSLLVLSMIFMGMSYGFGFSSFSQRDFFAYVIKFSFIVTLISPTSWRFFYDYLFTFFIEGTDSLIIIMSGQFASVIDDTAIMSNMGGAAIDSVSNPHRAVDTFAFLNKTFEHFFNPTTNYKMQALLVSLPIGFILALMIYIGMGLFVFAVFKAVIVYIFTIIMVSLMLFIAPVIIPTIMFRVTKDIFDRWLKQLGTYMLQPVLMMMVLSIFNIFVYTSFHYMMHFPVCYSCLWDVDLPLSESFLFFNGLLGDFDHFCMFYGYAPWGVGGAGDPSVKLAKTPVGLFMVLIFIILTNAMVKFIDWAVEVGMSLTAGVMGVSINETKNDAMKGGTDLAKETLATGASAAKFTGKAAGRVGDLSIAAASGGKYTHAVTDTAKRIARAPRSLIPMPMRGAMPQNLKTSTEKKADKAEAIMLRHGGLSEKEKKEYLSVKATLEEDAKGWGTRGAKEKRNAAKKALATRAQVLGGARGKIGSGVARNYFEEQVKAAKGINPAIDPNKSFAENKAALRQARKDAVKRSTESSEGYSGFRNQIGKNIEEGRRQVQEKRDKIQKKSDDISGMIKGFTDPDKDGKK